MAHRLLRTSSAQDLLAAAEKHTVNGPSIRARLAAALKGKLVATGADVTEALPGSKVPAPRRKLARDPEVAA